MLSCICSVIDHSLYRSHGQFQLFTTDHFTVVCLVAWPLSESEAGIDFVLMETSMLFYANSY